MGLSNVDSVKNRSLFQYVSKIHVVESDGPFKKWEIFAQSGESLVDQHRWRLHNLKLLFYSQNLFQFQVEALRGKVDFHAKDMKLRDEIRIFTKEGYEISADRIYYRDSSGYFYIWGGKIHKWEGGLQKAHTRAIKTVISEEKMFVSKGYFFHYIVKKNPLYVVGTDAEITKRKGIRFENSVMVLFFGTRLFSDRAELIYKDDKIVSLLLKGNVIMLRKKELIFSKELYIDLLKDSFVFEEEILWIQDGEKILGDKLKIKERGKNISIEGAVIRASRKDINKIQKAKEKNK